MVEQLLAKQQVVGSNPISRSSAQSTRWQRVNAGPPSPGQGRIFLYNRLTRVVSNDQC